MQSRQDAHAAAKVAPTLVGGQIAVQQSLNMGPGIQDDEVVAEMPSLLPDEALITVAVCSYNRQEFLRKLVPALLTQRGLSAGDYKIIIVENGDDPDAHKALAAEFQRSSNLSLVRSSPPGLARARNAALAACTTTYIVYIDDDAIPKKDWLDAILNAFKVHDPSIVAGPIYPNWQGSQPDWLPQKYMGCLTVLDYGLEDHWLTGDEFAFGANMAFKTEALREVGGFNVGLGRSGGSALLSEEESEVQSMLRKRGHRIFYAAAAGVMHEIHANRLTRNFFRARMAWQAVSELLHNPPKKHFERSQQEIAIAADKLGLNEFVAKLMVCSDAESFSAQLDLIYHFFAVVLGSSDLDDRRVESALASANENSAANHPGDERAALDSYELSAPILPSTRHLIIEGQPTHFFLYALYADLPQSQLLLFPHNLWENCDAALAYIQRSITPSIRTLTFVTLDPLICGPNRQAFSRLARGPGISCFGILHRLPGNAQQEAAFRELAPQLAGIVVLAQELVAFLGEKFGLSNVRYLPHHAPLADYVARNRQQIREKIGASDAQLVFSIIGQARRGKGIDLLLDALDYVAKDDLENMLFLIAGRAEDPGTDALVRSIAEKKGVAHYIDLRSTENPLKYDTLSDREFGEYIAASDAGLLLYQHEQRHCMSGVAPNYVWGYKPVIALANSVIGRIVRDHELGIAIEEETPQAVAIALSAALRLHRQGWTPSPGCAAYRRAISPNAVLGALAGILGGQGDLAPAALDTCLPPAVG